MNTVLPLLVSFYGLNRLKDPSPAASLLKTVICNAVIHLGSCVVETWVQLCRSNFVDMRWGAYEPKISSAYHRDIRPRRTFFRSQGQRESQEIIWGIDVP
jgi:hypothetical protein